VSDRDQVDHAGQEEWVYSSHPDRSGTMSSHKYPKSEKSDQISSGWSSSSGRGLLDINGAFDDGSVRAYRGMVMRDRRSKAVPWFLDEWLTLYVPFD
jgi:hypothetical protein